MRRVEVAGRAGMHVDRRLLGWGLFFILVGAVPLATRAGLVDPASVRAWPSLWPLLLIGWGIGLVLRRAPVEWLGGAVTAIVFGAMGGGLLATGFSGSFLSSGCGGPAAGTAFESQSGSFANTGTLNTELGCGSLTVRAIAGSDWSVSGTQSDGRAPDVSVNRSTVTIAPKGRGSLFGDDPGRADWTLAVPTNAQVGLAITVNAGEATGNLDGANLGEVDLTVNAGSARLDLAGAGAVGDLNATVNAGSAVLQLPSGARSADLSLNAGSLDLCLPAGTPVRVRWSGTLGSNNFEQAGLARLDRNTWQTADFNPLSPSLDLRVSATAGSFGLHPDGVCPA
jgi:hypothetical protein